MSEEVDQVAVARCVEGSCPREVENRLKETGFPLPVSANQNCRTRWKSSLKADEVPKVRQGYVFQLHGSRDCSIARGRELATEKQDPHLSYAGEQALSG